MQRTAKKCTKIYNARAQPLFFSVSLLFGDVLVDVTDMVCLSSLLGGGIPPMAKLRAISNHYFMLIFFYSFHSNMPEAISCLIGRGRFVTVYKQNLGNTAYLPDQSAYSRDLVDTLCTR